MVDLSTLFRLLSDRNTAVGLEAQAQTDAETAQRRAAEAQAKLEAAVAERERHDRIVQAALDGKEVFPTIIKGLG